MFVWTLDFIVVFAIDNEDDGEDNKDGVERMCLDDARSPRLSTSGFQRSSLIGYKKNCTLHALYFVDLNEDMMKRNKFRFCEFQIL